MRDARAHLPGVLLAATAAAVGALLCVPPATAVAAFTQPAVPQPQQLCTPEEPALRELSGLATDGQHLFATPDGGTRLRVFVLDPATCAVVDTITGPIDPYDVEDLARADDGSLWLADTGDNDLDRATVALHRLAPDGTATLFRLTYPDGSHDAEALLLDSAQVPLLVTKDLAGARVYRPSGPLAAPGPTPLEHVATVRLRPTTTPGGPAGSLGSALVTGGAVSADGQVVALRTYTDAYLFPAPDRDVLSALRREPVRIPLPDEPWGEAVALTPDGALLSASEWAPESRSGAPIRVVTSAAALVTPGAGVVEDARDARSEVAEPGVGAEGAAASGAGEPGALDTAGPDGEPGTGMAPWQAAVVAAGVATVLVVFSARRRRG